MLYTVQDKEALFKALGSSTPIMDDFGAAVVRIHSRSPEARSLLDKKIIAKQNQKDRAKRKNAFRRKKAEPVKQGTGTTDEKATPKK